MGIDLLADMFTNHSPFHFGYNNPISFMDPMGLAPNKDGNNSEILPEVEIIVIPPQIPPGSESGFPPFGSVPVIMRALEDLSRLFNPYSPFPDTDLPELVIDNRNKNQEAKNTQIDEFVWGVGTANTIVQVGADRAANEYSKEIFKSSAEKGVQSKNIAKVATKVGVGVSLGYAGYTLYTTESKTNSDYARAAGAVIITASGFIPYVGPIFSIGLGLLDANGYFDNFYNSFN